MPTIPTRPDAGQTQPSPGVDRFDSDVAWLATCPPMMSGAELATPFLQGIYALFGVGERVESLDFPATWGTDRDRDGAPWMREAQHVLAETRRAIDLACTGFRCVLSPGELSEQIVVALRSALCVIAKVDELAQVCDADEVMTLGMGPAS